MPTRSRRQEQRAAEGLGGRTTPGSGAGWAVKNDVRTEDRSFEVKYTDKKSYSLKLEDLLRAERHALLDSGRSFGFLVGFGQQVGQGSMRIDREFVVIPREDYEVLVNGHPQ